MKHALTCFVFNRDVLIITDKTSRDVRGRRRIIAEAMHDKGFTTADANLIYQYLTATNTQVYDCTAERKTTKYYGDYYTVVGKDFCSTIPVNGTDIILGDIDI